jgi:ribosomal protein S21
VDLNLQSVVRKEKEPFESLLRRFNRKVQQSGNLQLSRRKQYFEKELSKRDEREIAIRKKVRKDAKTKQELLKGF